MLIDFLLKFINYLFIFIKLALVCLVHFILYRFVLESHETATLDYLGI
jgi:hypothetical protein